MTTLSSSVPKTDTEESWVSGIGKGMAVMFVWVYTLSKEAFS